jgi:hypothetical protein
VAHLTGGAERQIQSMVRDRKGDAAPPPSFAPMDVAALSASNAQRDIVMRERLGDALLDAFITQYDRLGQLLAQFGPVDWDTLCWHARQGAMPAREYVDLRIQELAIHDWDIRVAFEPEHHLAPESLPILVNWGRRTRRGTTWPPAGGTREGPAPKVALYFLSAN